RFAMRLTQRRACEVAAHTRTERLRATIGTASGADSTTNAEQASMTHNSAVSADAEISLSELVMRLRAFLRLVWLDRRRLLRSLAVTIPLSLFVAFCSADQYTA